jgi:hypothetical protein
LVADPTNNLLKEQPSPNFEILSSLVIARRWVLRHPIQNLVRVSNGDAASRPKTENKGTVVRNPTAKGRRAHPRLRKVQLYLLNDVIA